MPLGEKRRVRFGGFEVDLATGELSTNGSTTRLQPQPLRVLTILLERPGEIVTREELRRRLWADDTFVDFDHSLNTDIKKLRQALGDDAATPRYIETLPKRGYRLIHDSPAVGETSSSSALSPVLEPAESQSPIRPKIRTIKALCWGLLIAGILATLFYSSSRSRVPYLKEVHQLSRTGNHKSPYGVRKAVSDGARIYFAERIHSQWKIVVMSVQGGEASIVDTGNIQNPHVFDISRGGSELLVGEFGFSESWLWIVPLPAGPPRRVGRTDTYSARFVPNGTHVIFAADKQLLVEGTDGSNRQLLLTADEVIRDFAISPDGRTLRLSAGGRIYESRSDGSGLHLYVPENRRRHCCGEWSPDGQFYVYSELDEHGNAHLFAKVEPRYWASRTTPQNPVQLSFGPIPFAFPTVSKDSQKVFVFGEVLKGELQIYDRDSGLLGPYLSGISAGSVDFSRDGEWITYVAFPEGTLWRSRLDGTEKMQLTFPPTGQVSNPKWSPDRRFIVFEEWVFQKRNLYVIPTGGGLPLLLTSDRIDPSWSPDGKFLVFSPAPSPDSTIELMNFIDLSTTVVPGSEGLCFPRWSRDGRHLLALSTDLKKLMLYSFAEKRWKQLYASDEIAFPSFSNDNRFIYFSHGFSEERGEIMRIRIADGRVERAADLRSIETTMPIFRLGGWFALTPDDQILVLRDRGSDELYSLDIGYR